MSLYRKRTYPYPEIQETAENKETVEYLRRMYHEMDQEASARIEDFQNFEFGTGTIRDLTVDYLKIYDSDFTHTLRLWWNEDEATAVRMLGFKVHGANRTLDLYENLTVADGNDVTLKAEDNDGAFTLDNANFEVENTNATQRNIKITSAKAGNSTLTLEDDSTVNQDLSSDATPTFAGVTLGDSHVTVNPRARAYLGTDQEDVADTTWVKVELDSESYDTGADFDSATNYRFVAPVSGYYEVKGSVWWNNPIADKIYYSAIYKDGSSVAEEVRHSSSTSALSVPVSDKIYVAATSYLELYVYKNTGAATEDIDGAARRTYMSVHLSSV